jgi:hypothetical protein
VGSVKLSKKKAETVLRQAAFNWQQGLKHMLEVSEDDIQKLQLEYDIEEIDAAFARLDK